MSYLRFKKVKEYYYLYEVEKRKVRGKGYQQKLVKYHGRVLGIDYKLPHRILNRVFVRDAFMCRQCGDSNNLTVDHQVSLLDGGDNSIENLHVLCIGCNVSKGRNVCDCVLKEGGLNG